MRIIAPMMILIMMTSTLAGCTGGDPDSGGEIDSDALNELIDQNLQDFINNTTITVNQEIHHHNNTTVVNNYYNSNTEYNNTTVIDGGEVTNQNYDQSSTYYNASSIGGNGTSNGIIRTIDFVFDLDLLWGNSPIIPGNRTSTYTAIWTYYDYATNSERTDIFTFDCGVYYLVGSANSSNEETYWENNNYYDDAWSDNGFNNTMRDIFHNVANDEDLRFTCDEDFYGYDSGQTQFYEIIYQFTIPEGFALSCLDTNSRAEVFDHNSGQSTGQYTYMRVDGVSWHCASWQSSIGGEYDMNVTISYNYLYENIDYRLLWSYKLISVLPHDQNDLDD